MTSMDLQHLRKDSVRVDLTRADSNRAEPDLDLVPADSRSSSFGNGGYQEYHFEGGDDMGDIFGDMFKICFMGRVALAAVPAVSISKAIG